MKTILLGFRSFREFGFLFFALLLPMTTVQAAAQPERPAITSVRLEGTNLVVECTVPAGIQRVCLESRQRLAGSSWVPRSIARPEEQGNQITFTVPQSGAMAILRVRADSEEPLPSSFYQGTKSFANQLGSGSGDTQLPPDAAAGPGGDNRDAGSGESDGSGREVVESDIWKIDGNTLYFFNQYRGLQVIDIEDPDAPVIRGQLDLPAAGEDMYLLDSGHVVLLARDGCQWTANGTQSRVLIVDVSGDQPEIIQQMPVQGSIQESRLVGSALYVVSYQYRRVVLSREPAEPDDPTAEPGDATDPDTVEQWENGSLVSAFDLSDPAEPISREPLWYPGYNNTINATDTYLFVATADQNNWWQSIVHIVDISSPDATLREYDSIRAAGRVQDKFKMHYNGSTFTVISESRRQNTGTLITKLETFRLPDPKSSAPISVTPLGELGLAEGERLFATRFDGDRAYVVTFLQIDPLFVIDLADPANPEVKGELEIPGWSTYLHPSGDKLVAVGTETNRVTVSLFDVADPEKPGMLDRVSLGEGYSWSEANQDEKAFKVLENEGLILVPFEGQSTDGYASQVQLVDLNETSLEKRGVIRHGFQPRRATVHQDRILSISGRALLSVNATDRDDPVVTRETELSWGVDQLFVQGDYLLEFTQGATWPGPTPPVVRVVQSEAPAQVIHQLELESPLPVAGASTHDGYLYVVQAQNGYDYPVAETDDGQKESPDDEEKPVPNLLITVIDLSDLPELKVTGETKVATDGFGWGLQLEAIWPKPDLLVWAGEGSYYRWGFPYYDVAMPEPGLTAAPIDGRFFPYYGGSGSGRFWAFDVSDPAAPELASEINLTQNDWWNFSEAFGTGPLVYVSHQNSVFLEDVTLDDSTSAEPTLVYDEESGEFVEKEPRTGVWVQRHYLNVIDFSDSTDPAVRDPVNIPGQLRGISHGGALLYTVGHHWNPEDSTQDWTEWLDASAYDGVSASLVDSLALPQSWPHPVSIHQGHVYLGRPRSSPDQETIAELETWNLSNDGAFTRLDRVELETAANQLVTLKNRLLVGQNSQVSVFDLTQPGQPAFLTTAQPDGCVGYQLDEAAVQSDPTVWVPLGAYGVWEIKLSSQQE